jgi:hypothetical protein
MNTDPKLEIIAGAICLDGEPCTPEELEAMAVLGRCMREKRFFRFDLRTLRSWRAKVDFMYASAPLAAYRAAKESKA